MQLTSEILTLLKKVYEDSFYTSSQLASQYASLPEFQDFFKMASIKCEKINQDLLRSKVSHPNLTDEEFIVYEVSKYAKVVIQAIYNFLLDYYRSFDTIGKLNKYSRFYPTLTLDFSDWLVKYSNIDEKTHKTRKYRNQIIYNIESLMDYKQAILDYISGMSDNYAIKAYSELIEF